MIDRKRNVERALFVSKKGGGERCECVALPYPRTDIMEELDERSIPIAPELVPCLLQEIEQIGSVTHALTLLVIHMIQREVSAIAATFPPPFQHASEKHFQQVIARVNHVLRRNDQMAVYGSAGAILLFPEVTYRGAHAILERVYSSVNLLQAQTMLPPLSKETTIELGIQTYAAPLRIEDLFRHVEAAAKKQLTLQPAISSASWAPIDESCTFCCPLHEPSSAYSEHRAIKRVPFMQLPKQCPRRLMSLIPHRIACKLRCAPVGRDQQRLTVAMADPMDQEKVHYLQKITGMAIFPVSCDEEDLNVLLSTGW
ncbi:diguanylate cyclase domain-containing protein [Tengunoibacter tsumagoiensis]|uniref:Type II secretion system protein GspE N-terminal domain-containing protein n=1 Tax=Tengunoibacter tsumagoiensis TaxID=2014871 RepID=A0A401ZWT1_9CHLR|nr:diguanylate cyclase [Tengunoibacter tsumagoiensis]GCE11194.1 hypothetical protein KTT_10530 [Tengunoibacter tsumagoiensis]